MKWVEIGYKLLSVLVIPLLLWGIKLEVNNAIQDQQIAQLGAEVNAAKLMRDGLVSQGISLGKIEEQLHATNRRLDDIKDDFRRSLPPK